LKNFYQAGGAPKIGLPAADFHFSPTSRAPLSQLAQHQFVVVHG